MNYYIIFPFPGMSTCFYLFADNGSFWRNEIDDFAFMISVDAETGEILTREIIAGNK